VLLIVALGAATVSAPREMIPRGGGACGTGEIPHRLAPLHSNVNSQDHHAERHHTEAITQWPIRELRTGIVKPRRPRGSAVEAKRRGFYEASSSQALIGGRVIAHTFSVRSDQCLGSLR
jgi:hypothetical protein